MSAILGASAGVVERMRGVTGTSVTSGRLIVDLGPLQPPAEVDVDGLPLRERVERGVPRLPVPVAGVLPAAERQVRLGASRARVDVHDPGFEVAHRAKGGVDVLRVHRRREPVLHLVRGRHRLVVAVDRDDGQHGTEDLLLGDRRHRLHAVEDRRGEEVAVIELAAGRPAAARHELALGPADPRIPLDLVGRGRVDERTDVHGLVEPGAEAEAGGAGLEATDELVRDGAIDDHAAARGAALPAGPERGPQDSLRREVEVGVAEHDDGVLAAELQAQALQPAAGTGRDRLARRRAAGERDHRHVRAVDDRVAHLTTGAGDEVDDTRREPRLVHQLDEEGRAQRRVRARLEHDGVPGHERRHHLPARDRDREVPWRDDPRDSERLPDRHRPLVRELRGNRVAEQAPAIRNAMSTPSWTWPRASARTLPISRVIARARRSFCSALSAPKRYRISPRFGAGVAFHAGVAISAARMAIATSAALPAWKRPTTSRVSAGLTDSNVSPDTPPTHRPAMNSWYVVGSAATWVIGCSSDRTWRLGHRYGSANPGGSWTRLTMFPSLSVNHAAIPVASSPATPSTVVGPSSRSYSSNTTPRDRSSAITPRRSATTTPIAVFRAVPAEGVS